jgi:hypothetical protein
VQSNATHSGLGFGGYSSRQSKQQNINNMSTTYIAAKIEGKNIALIDKNGFRAGGVGSPGLAWDEVFTAAYISGNHLVGTTSKNTVITWDITGTPSIINRR